MPSEAIIVTAILASVLFLISLVLIKPTHRLSLILAILVLAETVAFYYLYSDYTNRISQHGVALGEFTYDNIYNWKLMLNYLIVTDIVLLSLGLIKKVPNWLAKICGMMGLALLGCLIILLWLVALLIISSI